MNVEQLRRLLAGQGNKKQVLIDGRPLTREDITITNVVEIVQPGSNPNPPPKAKKPVPPPNPPKAEVLSPGHVTEEDLKDLETVKPKVSRFKPKE